MIDFATDAFFQFAAIFGIDSPLQRSRHSPNLLCVADGADFGGGRFNRVARRQAWIRTKRSFD